METGGIEICLDLESVSMKPEEGLRRYLTHINWAGDCESLVKKQSNSSYLGWFEWVVDWECEINKEGASFIDTALRCFYDGKPGCKIISFRTGLAVWHRWSRQLIHLSLQSSVKWQGCTCNIWYKTNKLSFKNSSVIWITTAWMVQKERKWDLITKT